MVDYFFPFINCFLLFFSMIFYWSSFYFPNIPYLYYIGKNLGFCINILFSLTLIIRWIQEGYFPLSNLYESLIFLAWSLSLFSILLETRTRSRLVGSILTPILFFLSYFASIILPIDMQKASPLVPSLQSNWLMMHVSMMMVSYATLLVGSLLSILYLVFFNYKKYRSFGSSLLEMIDLWSYRIIALGFPFLTIGIISGAVWANEAWGSYWSWDPKETWALITWLTFAIYLHFRIIKGWGQEKAAIIGLIGFFIIWVCYLGVNFLSKGLHSYGWLS